MAVLQAEYIWLDGTKATPQLRSKTRILRNCVAQKAEQLPEWAFDGSSTSQAEGHSSDCLLKPVCVVGDPLRSTSDVLVLCEVMNPDGSPHVTNTRARLLEIAKQFDDDKCWFGIEQEYTLFKPSGMPLAWDERNNEPPPQGPYYCGVGADKIFGRKIIEAHTKACLDAKLSLWGTNSEVMPGQWEFQVGPISAPLVADELWIARWLLQRIAEDYGVVVNFHPKPKDGDWNGAGAHTNFSTRWMRESVSGGDPRFGDKMAAVLKKLGHFHKNHIAVYGADNNLRLTGRHETCSINDFRYGQFDRGASIRIPVAKGYIEDRRPAANMDPYKVCTALLETICGEGFDPAKFGWEADVKL